MAYGKRGTERRGVLLLLILGFLTMFSLVGITFVMITGQHRAGSEVSQRMEQQASSPEADLNQAVLQLVRGSKNTSSPIAPWSLLEDMYGQRWPSYHDKGNKSGNNDWKDWAQPRIIGTWQGVSTRIPVMPEWNGDGAIPTATSSMRFVDIPEQFIATNTGWTSRLGDMSWEDVNGSPVPWEIQNVWYKEIMVGSVGCVLTMLSGPHEGKSTRVVQYLPYRYDASNPTSSRSLDDCLIVMPFDGTTGRPEDGDRFMINPVPFSGTGAGYAYDDGSGSMTGPLLDAADLAGHEYALMPNARHFVPRNAGNRLRARDDYLDPAGFGGANEGYDAVDYQNMHLAWVELKDLTISTDDIIIPSFHRPALVRYWMDRLGYDDTAHTHGVSPGKDNEWVTKIERRAILRPMHWDHKALGFDGSNPYSNPDLVGDPAAEAWAETGPWDVDNDGDGTADSVWLDIGLPVRSTADGRLYKPLVAIMCLDLDGCVNVNAHGNVVTTGTTSVTPLPGRLAGATGFPPQSMLGHGYGPAEVRLDKVFGVDSKNVMQGWTYAGDWLAGRYGEAGRKNTLERLPGLYEVTNNWQRVNRLTSIKLSAYPFDNSDVSLVPTVFSSVPDLWGQALLGIDYAGRPPVASHGADYRLSNPPTNVYSLQGTWNTIRGANPYALNLSGRMQRAPGRTAGSGDSPFTPAELEALLRRYDADVYRLPDRLVRLAKNAIDAGITGKDDLRHLVTTESWDLPSPNHTYSPTSAIANEPRDRHIVETALIDGGGGLTSTDTVIPGNGRVTHIASLLRTRLIDGRGYTLPLTTNQEQTIMVETNQMLSWDLMANVRMDLNRPFGNGRDDDNDGVVDEPTELGLAKRNPWGNLFPDIDFTQGNYGPFDPGNGLVINEMAREQYARHLYVLAMLCVWDNLQAGYAQPDLFTGGPTPSPRADTIRRIAQWAVNVVDFRDADSIMTRFRYDPNPFNGWTSNNTTNVVWGCERPELLITETLAFHDRRIEDTGTDDGIKKDVAGGDKSFDQTYVPLGSLFVELYNPWTDAERLPRELYKQYGSTSEWGVDLGKDVYGSPVWRLAIVGESDVANLDEDPDVKPSIIDREIYFTEVLAKEKLNPYCSVDTARYTLSPIRPNHYAVIGPDEESVIGDRDLTSNSMRRILLKPGGAAPEVQVFGDGTTDNIAAQPVNEPVAVVVNSGNRMNVSQPLGGYTRVGANAGVADGAPLAIVEDAPYDAQHPTQATIEATMSQGTTLRFRVVHLQRLADPTAKYNNDPTVGIDYNPYRTVDSATIDLTAFNGLEKDSDPLTGDWMVKDYSTSGNLFIDGLFARQRGETVASRNVTNHNNLWSVNTGLDWTQTPPPQTDPWNPGSTDHSYNALAGGAFYNEPFVHTLGYLNATYGEPIDATLPLITNLPALQRKRYMGLPSLASASVHPFPWFVWNNRPFANTLELLQVPHSSSSRLLWEYQMADSGEINSTVATELADPYKSQWAFGAWFRHLPNFFSASSVPKDSLNLHRLLEYVHVPSRFVGTETILSPRDPEGFGKYNMAIGKRLQYSGFSPPFNKVSNYRDPGRMNVNTAKEKPWTALMAEREAYLPFNTFFKNRLDTPISMPEPPTQFGMPFRSGGGVNMVPLTSLRPTTRNPLEASMLREGNPGLPLFKSSTNMQNKQYNHADRNSYMRYESLQRLSSMTTTRSNVHAIWATVGYFEVEKILLPAGATKDEKDEFARVYPDGYTLGKELGSDTGDIKRHRAFYIHDRTIPVGFVRGEDHNVENGFLLKRFIE